MSSPTSQMIEDDDEEFDWEAAVREIDVACQSQTKKTVTLNKIEPAHQVSAPSSNPTTSTNNGNCSNVTHFSNAHKKPSTSRQSVLHKFFRLPVPIDKQNDGEPSPKSQPKELNSNPDQVHGEEMISCIKIDASAAHTWIYPVNVSLRDYQLNITREALFSNTLVALPTGLGKTLIAAVVMYNYFRWFPEGKIVFAAPSRPLVMQQIEACHNIVGISQEWTTDMTGQLSPLKRACLWKTKRVFFVTPQVLEKDIKSGSCLVRHLVCLVIDEAHRAMGNYSYCVAVRELMEIPIQLRILGLTATPGSKQQTIQHVIDNLQISTMEYRNESDNDVIPYVHDRKVEVIKVAMGEDANEINNLLLEVIRPFVARLYSLKVLQYRDIQTFSPCDLLNSRDKFRQAPPTELTHMRCGEVEGYFALLITLYHIRKLLSSHGIRPAFDMLEEKLQKGSFAGHMNRNEILLKAKLLMQQSLSHGAPSPKLSKMLEVLIDHFKTKDAQQSRVIIFSNFRGSVRDIMNALEQVREIVKATEFIGQSSGKALKGQSQKVQQAVLEKFRTGGFNVIVATSIGEEGLDIMEVDLVICFDANVSPLRMIQRMGRTGRKREGRVVVLSYEGSEMKGYLRKQANSKAIKKHMRNGGMNSFNFHPSPRMIPHIYKPEVQFVELSIEQFVPRGRKVNDEDVISAPLYKTKLDNAEIDLIATYFHPTIDNTWRPSLISFPSFQAVPSKVNKVVHSFRTGMLIHMMQQLQELPSSKKRKTSLEGQGSSCLHSKAITCEGHENNLEDMVKMESSPANDLNEVSKSILPLARPLESEQKMRNFQVKKVPKHCHQLNPDILSVDTCERITVTPVLAHAKTEFSPSKCASPISTTFLSPDSPNSSHCMAFPNEPDKAVFQMKGILVAQNECKEKDNLPTFVLCSGETIIDGTFAGTSRNIQTPISRGGIPYGGEAISRVLDTDEEKIPALADQVCDDSRDTDLSPRLADFIESGVVPESPIDDTDCISHPKLRAQMLLETSVAEQNRKEDNESGSSGRHVLEFCCDEATETPILSAKSIAPKGCSLGCQMDDDIQSPLANLSNNIISKEWSLSSADKTNSIEQVTRFRRLRKYADLHRGHCKEVEKNMGLAGNMATSRGRIRPVAIKDTKGKNLKREVKTFIEEEAEVSTDVTVSEDDDDDKNNSSYDDSFIDDRIDSTTGSTQAESSRVDMLAIYRRSLLSQSPMAMEMQRSNILKVSPDLVVPKSRINGSESSSGTASDSHQTPMEMESVRRDSNSTSFHVNHRRTTLGTTHHSNSDGHEGHENREGTLKRKLCFHRIESECIRNLEPKFSVPTEPADLEPNLLHQKKQFEAEDDVFYDQFFASIDFDAVEEQASKLAKSKAGMPMQKRATIDEPVRGGDLNLLGSPSFDLGI